jgi:alpha-1,2-mannosyltransferase
MLNGVESGKGWGGVGARARDRPTVALLGAVIGIVALLARLLPVLRGGGLGGVLAYDDGVYFGAADSFVFGRLPYRDFVLLHPPGIVLVLAPFAELARWTSDVRGLAVARLAFIFVGAVSAVLVFLIARRIAPVAGLVGGLFYALWEPATYAERTTLLEPLVNVGLLAALLCLGDLRTTTRRRALLAGVALGLATAVKLWAVVPLVVLALWLLARAGPRRALAFLGAAAGAATLVCLPFFLAAPDRMMQLVVSDQLGRTKNGISTTRRLLSITDVHLTGSPVTARATAAAVLLVVAIGLLGLRLAIVERHARPWVSLLAAQTGLLLASPSYFTHYATYVAPATALVVGGVAGLSFLWLRLHAARLRPVSTLVAAAVLAFVGTASQYHSEGGFSGPDRAVRRALSDARCVTGDTTATLIAADVLSRDLRRGCPLIVDVTGVTYTQAPGDLAQGNTVIARRHDLSWQHRITRYFLNSDAVIVQRGNPDGLDQATLARLRSVGLATQTHNYAVYEHSPARGPG